MKLKVLIAAGGTGGHLFPAQQLSALLQKEGDCEVFFAGHRLAESPFFEREGAAFQEIAAAPLKKIVPFLFSAWRGFWQSFRLLRRFQPDVVVGFGSFHSFPVLLAAAALRKKIVLFEANCLLGKVNRLFLPAAKKLALQFPLERSVAKEVFVPLLPWTWTAATGTAAIKTTVSSQEARKAFGLEPDRFTVLVFGGSQGAAFLNQTFSQAARLLEKRGVRFQAIHLTGKGGEASYAGCTSPVCVKPFEKEMRLAYAAADIAVCRSGAGTAAELIRYQIPALLIPFPYAADDHQKANGKYLAEKIGGARMLLQREADPEKLASEILALKEELEKRKAALKIKAAENEGKIDFADLVKRIGNRR